MENMKAAAELDDLLNRFHLCSRELFNQFFHDRGISHEDGWIRQSRHAEVEALLFEKLVIEPASLSVVPYGAVHPQIGVELRSSVAPIMINRDIEPDSGYWDYHVREMTSDALLGFRSFFDWINSTTATTAMRWSGLSLGRHIKTRSAGTH